MISGPYTAGGADASARAANLRAMNLASVEVFRKGHTPLIGVNMALPMIEAAGPEHFDQIMMPLSLALAQRCDAVLRIGGPSRGADQETELFERAGKPVYTHLNQIATTP